MTISGHSSGHQDSGFLPVLVAAIVMFAVSPAMADSDLGVAALNLLAFAVLLGALRAAGVAGRWLTAAAGLGTFAGLLAVLAAFDLADLGGPRIVLTYGLWIVAPLAVLVRVTRDKSVTMNTIYGAITAYLLFGMLLGFQYLAIEEISSGSFAIPGEPKDDNTSELLYYSLVTQTTLGYGDITPVRAIPRTLSVIQAVIGQMYLVVLMARFVALQIAHANDVEKAS
ncbi:MAG TPA: ion channel [Dehalococcoidia bacterium]